MEPLTSLAEQYEYLASETARRLGKKVKTQFKGFEIQAGEKIRDALSVLLLHAIRNAVDHGIAPGGEGTITCALQSKAGVLQGKLQDDGPGPNLAKIARRAIEAGIAQPDDVVRATDDEKLEWLFEPGFSTVASQPTSVSGRGIGLDAIRAALAEVKGEIKAAIAVDGGFELRFRIPLDQQP
jgi:two-component system chemotaxis sensor kinase CheA